MNFLKSLFGRNTASANEAGAAFRAKFEAMRIAVPTNNGGPSTYPMSRLTDADKEYLMRMVTPYVGATRGRQIFYDILTNDAGQTWIQLGGDVTPAGKAFQAQVSAIIAYADRLPGAYAHTPVTYDGPLVAIVGAAAATHAR